MPSLEEIQEQLLDKEALLAELELENITPVIIGGYNARPYSSVLGLVEEPRPTEIKGMWRWWARALVSGALIEDKKIDVGSIAKADEIIAHVLGGRIGEKLKPSKVLLKIKLLEKNVDKLSDYNKDSKDNKDSIVRLKLLAQGIEDWEYEERFTAYKGLKLKIKIYKYLSPGTSVPTSFYEFAIASLLLSLVFSGLGAITTRAFGSVKVKINRTAGYLKESQKFKELLDDLYEKRLDLSRAKIIISKLVDLALESSRNYLNDLQNHSSLTISGLRAGNLPSIPSVVRSSSNMFRFEVLPCRSTNVYQVLSVISSSVLKQNMKSPCFNVGNRAPGAHIHTFIIGLPRSSEIPYGRYRLKTGYIVLSNRISNPVVYRWKQISVAISAVDNAKTSRLRRVSTIGFTVLKNEPVLVLMYGMLAKDLDLIKKELIHRGVRGRTGRRGFVNQIVDTPLNNVNVINEFNRLWNCIVSLMRRC